MCDSVHVGILGFTNSNLKATNIAFKQTVTCQIPRGSLRVRGRGLGVRGLRGQGLGVSIALTFGSAKLVSCF